MTASTHSEFGVNTEATTVAAAFPNAIKGKTIIITGVNKGGLGFTTAEAFASQSPARLIFTGRSVSKPQECIDTLKERFPSIDYRILQVDLSSQKSIRAAASEFLSWSDVPKVDILINNAGVMNIPERTISADGIEAQFATNHIGHFLLTNLILPKLIKAAEDAPKGATRIVNVSSAGVRFGPVRFSDINFDKKQKDLAESERPNVEAFAMVGGSYAEEDTYHPMASYGQSKSANILFGVGLNHRLYEKYGILSIGLHPGSILTELGRNTKPEQIEKMMEMVRKGAFTLKTQGAGSSTTLVAAVDPKLGVAEEKEGKEGWGAYLSDCQIAEAPQWAVKGNLADKLWTLSEDLVKEKFQW